MPKLVNLIKRCPDLAVEEFQARLSSEYGPLVAAVPQLRRYVQSLALPQGYAKGELLFDAIAELTFADELSCRHRLATREFAEAETLAKELIDPARSTLMPVEVIVIKDGAVPHGAVKNIEFVTRRPGIDLVAFHRYWREVHGPLAARIPVLLRYEQHHLPLSAYAGDRAAAYDGLAVTWFASTADMRRGTSTPEYIATRADEANFLPDGHLPIIITRQQVLKE